MTRCYASLGDLMKRRMIKLARLIYRVTPFAACKQFYLNFLYFVIRGRKTQATVDGIAYDLDLSEVIDVGVYLGRYEPDVTAAISCYCHSGNIVLDIGANIGAHTLRLAKIVGESGKVFAFEPMDYAYRKLAQNISLNPFHNVNVCQIALSDRNLRQQKICYRSGWRTDGKQSEAPSTVNFIRLDDWCAKHQVSHVDLIKLDVDGNELAVLIGGYLLLERCRPVILIEAADYHFRDVKLNPLIMLSKLGYHFSNALTLKPYANIEMIAQDCEGVDSINLIAVIDSSGSA
jgi:FkbM family methyltransferase